MIDTKPLSDRIEIIPRKKIEDRRGWFLKTINGNEKDNPFPCEVYITSAKPGESKGGHYHIKAQEWFTLIKGEALLTIVDIETKLRMEIRLNENNPVTIYIPPRQAHNFKNTGKSDFILLAYTDQKYFSEDTIIFNLT